MTKWFLHCSLYFNGSRVTILKVITVLENQYYKTETNLYPRRIGRYLFQARPTSSRVFCSVKNLIHADWAVVWGMESAVWAGTSYESVWGWGGIGDAPYSPKWGKVQTLFYHDHCYLQGIPKRELDAKSISGWETKCCFSNMCVRAP